MKSQSSIIFKAKYALGIPDKINFFKVYLELGLEPPDLSNAKFLIKNLVANKEYQKEEIRITPLGTKKGVSPFYLISIPVLDSELQNGKNIEIEIRYEAQQKVPYSIFDFHVNRYIWGIDSVDVHITFSPTVRINMKKFDNDLFVNDFTPEEMKSMIKDAVLENKRYREITLRIEDPSNFFGLTFTTFS